MGLNLNLAADDMILMSDGTVIVVDNVTDEAVTITVANVNNIYIKEHAIGIPWRIGKSAIEVSDAHKARFSDELVAHFSINAPRSIIINRFHHGQTDAMLDIVLGKFSSDSRSKLIDVLTELDYFIEN